jgi:hypothetical protein
MIRKRQSVIPSRSRNNSLRWIEGEGVLLSVVSVTGEQLEEGVPSSAFFEGSSELFELAFKINFHSSQLAEVVAVDAAGFADPSSTVAVDWVLGRAVSVPLRRVELHRGARYVGIADGKGLLVDGLLGAVRGGEFEGSFDSGEGGCEGGLWFLEFEVNWDGLRPDEVGEEAWRGGEVEGSITSTTG